jgi:hypothetical protein
MAHRPLALLSRSAALIRLLVRRAASWMVDLGRRGGCHEEQRRRTRAIVSLLAGVLPCAGS